MLDFTCWTRELQKIQYFDQIIQKKKEMNHLRFT